MDARLIWDETKRHANLAKHGLDFADAWWVLDCDIRMDVPRERCSRIVSFRVASTAERTAYRDWLAQETDDA